MAGEYIRFNLGVKRSKNVRTQKTRKYENLIYFWKTFFIIQFLFSPNMVDTNYDIPTTLVVANITVRNINNVQNVIRDAYVRAPIKMRYSCFARIPAVFNTIHEMICNVEIQLDVIIFVAGIEENPGKTSCRHNSLIYNSLKGNDNETVLVFGFQKYEVEFLLQQQWLDPRLAYQNKSRYDYLNAIHHHENIWLPDTYFIMHGDFKDPLDPMHFALRIYRNGTITYLTRRHLILSCQGSLHIFPFDDPLCSFAMESSKYFAFTFILYTIICSSHSPAERKSRIVADRLWSEYFARSRRTTSIFVIKFALCKVIPQFNW